ncbi:MAG: hypothetical protein F6K62_10970 [Sphaerospermopsis sp. SIO1G2]|nr:hypothetical protein [Sphaerospermopsis sp. SIO1G2]
MGKQAMTQQASRKQQQAKTRDAYKKAIRQRQSFTMPQTDKKIVVSLGHNSASAGRLSKQFSPREQWHEIRVDTHESVEPDVKSELWAIGDIPDASVDAVWVGYILQRFTFQQARSIVQEVMRMMKDGAELLVAVPDLQMAATYIARDEADMEMYHSPAGMVTPPDMLFGFRQFTDKGDMVHAHKSGYTSTMLSDMLRELGVCNMKMKRNRFNLVALGMKLPYGHPDRVDRVLMMREDTDKHPAMPDAPAQHASSGAAPVRYADKLDVAPQLWKPLGLKKDHC